MPKLRATPRSTLISPALLRAWPLPMPGGEGKEGRGSVLIVGGSQEIPGAVMLAALAALRAGAGKLQVATVHSVAPMLAVHLPEARVIGLPQAADGELGTGSRTRLRRELSRCRALLLGPGMMKEHAITHLIQGLPALCPDTPVVLDAAALAALRVKAHPLRGRAILTPHAGEMARLCGLERDEVVARAPELALEVAARFGAVVALKGERTHIATPEGLLFHNTAGNAGLATSGSGDVLSGIITGLCARGADIAQATVWGVFLHARAGDALARRMGTLGLLARELPAEIPALLHRLSARAAR